MSKDSTFLAEGECYTHAEVGIDRIDGNHLIVERHGRCEIIATEEDVESIGANINQRS